MRGRSTRFTMCGSPLSWSITAASYLPTRPSSCNVPSASRSASVESTSSQTATYPTELSDGSALRREDYPARYGWSGPARGAVLPGMARPRRLRILVLLRRLRCGDPGRDPLWHRRLLAQAQLPRQKLLASGLAPSSGSRASCLPRTSSRRLGRIPRGQPSSSEGLNQAGQTFRAPPVNTVTTSFRRAIPTERPKPKAGPSATAPARDRRSAPSYTYAHPGNYAVSLASPTYTSATEIPQSGVGGSPVARLPH